MGPRFQTKPKGLLYSTWDWSRAKDFEIVFDTLKGGPALMAFLQAASHVSVGGTSQLDLRDPDVQRKAATRLQTATPKRSTPAAVVAAAVCVILQPPTEPEPLYASDSNLSQPAHSTAALLRSHGYLDVENRPTLRCAEDDFCEGIVAEALFGDSPKSQNLTSALLMCFPGTGSIEITPNNEVHFYINALDCQKLRREVWRRTAHPSPGCDYTLADDPQIGGYCFAFTSCRHGPASNHLADIFSLHVREPRPPAYDARHDFLMGTD